MEGITFSEEVDDEEEYYSISSVTKPHVTIAAAGPSPSVPVGTAFSHLVAPIGFGHPSVSAVGGQWTHQPTFCAPVTSQLGSSFGHQPGGPQPPQFACTFTEDTDEDADSDDSCHRAPTKTSAESNQAPRSIWATTESDQAELEAKALAALKVQALLNGTADDILDGPLASELTAPAFGGFHGAQAQQELRPNHGMAGFNEKQSEFDRWNEMSTFSSSAGPQQPVVKLLNIAPASPPRPCGPGVMPGFRRELTPPPLGTVHSVVAQSGVIIRPGAIVFPPGPEEPKPIPEDVLAIMEGRARDGGGEGEHTTRSSKRMRIRDGKRKRGGKKHRRRRSGSRSSSRASSSSFYSSEDEKAKNTDEERERAVRRAMRRANKEKNIYEMRLWRERMRRRRSPTPPPRPQSRAMNYDPSEGMPDFVSIANPPLPKPQIRAMNVDPEDMLPITDDEDLQIVEETDGGASPGPTFESNAPEDCQDAANSAANPPEAENMKEPAKLPFTDLLDRTAEAETVNEVAQRPSFTSMPGREATWKRPSDADRIPRDASRGRGGVFGERRGGQGRGGGWRSEHGDGGWDSSARGGPGTGVEGAREVYERWESYSAGAGYQSENSWSRGGGRYDDRYDGSCGAETGGVYPGDSWHSNQRYQPPLPPESGNRSATISPLPPPPPPPPLLPGPGDSGKAKDVGVQGSGVAAGGSGGYTQSYPEYSQDYQGSWDYGGNDYGYDYHFGSGGPASGGWGEMARGPRGGPHGRGRGIGSNGGRAGPGGGRGGKWGRGGGGRGGGRGRGSGTPPEDYGRFYGY